MAPDTASPMAPPKLELKLRTDSRMGMLFLSEAHMMDICWPITSMPPEKAMKIWHMMM